MRTTRFVLLAPCTLLALAGCEQILGFSDHTLGGTGGSGSTTATTTTTAAGTGGATTTTTTTTTTATGTGGGTTGSGGTGGSGGACADGATRPCYDGPDGTKGVGLCVAGVQSCAQGVFGPCQAEVLPAVEKCGTPSDESCDGEAECSGACRWSKHFGDAAGQYATAVATDNAGNIAVIGRFTGGIDLGGGPFASGVGDQQIFVARFDPRGKHLFSKAFGSDTSAQSATGIAISGAHLVVAGVLDTPSGGLVNFGGPDLQASNRASFVALLGENGDHVMSRLLGAGLGELRVTAAAASPDGSIFLAGDYSGPAQLDGGTAAFPDGGAQRSFIAKLDNLGSTLWAVPFGGDPPSDAGSPIGDQSVQSITVDKAGDPIVALSYKGSVSVPGSPSSASCASTGAAAVKLSGASGLGSWVFATCDPQGTAVQTADAIAVNSTGDVYLAGSFNKTIQLGAAGNYPSSGLHDLFLVKLTPAGGPLSAVRLGDGADQSGVVGLAIDGADQVTLAGRTNGPLDAGGGALPVLGKGAFLVKLNKNLNHLWSRGFSDQGGTLASDNGTLATMPTGELVWAAGFNASTDLGCGTLTAIGGNNDALLAVLAP